MREAQEISVDRLVIFMETSRWRSCCLWKIQNKKVLRKLIRHCSALYVLLIPWSFGYCSRTHRLKCHESLVSHDTLHNGLRIWVKWKCTPRKYFKDTSTAFDKNQNFTMNVSSTQRCAVSSKTSDIFNEIDLQRGLHVPSQPKADSGIAIRRQMAKVLESSPAPCQDPRWRAQACYLLTPQVNIANSKSSY